jgi:hypothetical protein
MSQVASAALVEALDGSGLYTEERNLGLWQQVPAELRLAEFSPRTLPDHPAFRWRLGWRPEWRGFDLQPLPEPMQRDVAYCVWRVIDSAPRRRPTRPDARPATSTSRPSASPAKPPRRCSAPAGWSPSTAASNTTSGNKTARPDTTTR